MLIAAVASLVASIVAAYLLGHLVVAPRGSFIRTKRGVWLTIILGGSVLLLPPQMTSLDVIMAPLLGTMGLGGDAALGWTAAFGKQPYLWAWAILAIAAFLVGMRVWNAGRPGWRGEPVRAFDSSAGARAASLLPMADTLADALDSLGRAGMSPADVRTIAGDIRDVGRRFSAELPQSERELYATVSARVTPALAPQVTGLLLEGAGRRSVG